MVKWIGFVVLIISGSVLGILYLQVKQLEQNPGNLPAPVSENSVRIAHGYRDGEHQYAGILYLPNSCHHVTAEVVQDSKILENFELRVTTKDKQMETAICSQIRSRYNFSVTKEGPPKVNLMFLLNGREKAFNLSEGSWQSDGASLKVTN